MNNDARAAVADPAKVKLVPRNESFSSRLSRLVSFAIWAALVTSLFENGIRYVFKAQFSPFRLLPYDLLAFLPDAAFWMVPISNVCFFVLVALAAALLLRPLSSSIAQRLAYLSVTFLGVSGSLWCLRTILHLHVAALLVLDLGLAALLVRLLAKRHEGFERLVQRSIWGLAATHAALAAGVYGWHWIVEQRALAALPAVAAQTPNVVLITLDTVRVQNMSLHGYSRPTTPYLDQFATTGTLFERAIAPSSWTLPTHASLFTGLLPHQLDGEFPQGPKSTHPTLAEVLKQQGFDTAGFIGNTYNCGKHTGLGRGFIHYREYGASWGFFLCSSLLPQMALSLRLGDPSLNPLRKPASEVNDEFLRWLDQPRRRPFFAFVNYFDAHEPFYVPDPKFDTFGDRSAAEQLARRQRLPLLESKTLSTSAPDTVQLAVDTYDGAIAYLDDQVRHLMEELDLRGLLQNTLVVITSDHGEHFGEHGLFGHGNSLYRQLIDVPLVLIFPGDVPENRRVSAPVSLVDIPATIVDLLDLPQSLPGRSLARCWRSPTKTTIGQEPIWADLEQGDSPDALNREGPIISLMHKGWHYVYYSGTQREELFDFEHDPLEANDVSQTDTGREPAARFRRYVDSVRGASPVREKNNSFSMSALSAIPAPPKQNASQVASPPQHFKAGGL